MADGATTDRLPDLASTDSREKPPLRNSVSMAAKPTSLLDLVSLRSHAEWNRIWALRVLAVLVGIVIPLLVIGRGATAILVPVIGGLTLFLIRWPHVGQRLARWKRDPLAVALGAMLTLWLVSVALSIKPGFSAAIWLQVLGLLLLIALLPSVLAEIPANRDLALKALVAASFAGSAIAVISIYLWPPLLSYVRPVDTPLSYHSALRLKSYAAVMPCLAPVVLWAGFRLRGAWPWLAAGCAALGILIVFGTGNRAAVGGYAGAAAIVAFFLVLGRVPRKYRVGIVVAVAAALAIAGILVIAELPRMPFDGIEQPKLPTWLIDAHRQVIWGFVWDHALERPWFGWGPSTANFLPGADDKIPVIGQTFVPLHAHNWVLQLFSDVGLLGLAAAAVAVGLFFRRLVSAAWSGAGAAWAALTLAGVFFVSTLANFSIWQSWWQSVFVILLSITLATAGPDTVAGSRRA